MNKGSKLRKVLTLTDPPPNWGYEASCYLISFASFFLIGLALINLLLCFSPRTIISSLALILLDLILLSRLKIVRELIKTLISRD